MRKILWLAGAMLFLAIVLLSVHVNTTNEEFSRYNYQWNGSSQFSERFDAAGGVLVQDLALLNAGNATVLLVIAPGQNFSGADVREYRRFLERGGMVLVADDFGTGNELLAGLGSAIRIRPGNLSSATRLYDDPSSVIVTPVRNDSLLLNITSLVLNRPAALEGGQALVTTSLLSWVDEDGDGRPGTEEDLGRFVVLSREEIGAGALYVLSDPSIFINTMDRARSGENRLFIEHLLDSPGVIALDQTHGRTGSSSALIAIFRLMQESVYSQLIIICMLTGVVAYLFRRGDDR